MKQHGGADRLERYRHVGIAIGLVELLGNEKPSGQSIDIAECVVKKFGLTWDDCLNASSLLKAMKKKR